MNEIVQILMERDCLTQAQAEDYIVSLRTLVEDGEMTYEEALEDQLGLEIDYMLDLVG